MNAALANKAMLTLITDDLYNELFVEVWLVCVNNCLQTINCRLECDDDENVKLNCDL